MWLYGGGAQLYGGGEQLYCGYMVVEHCFIVVYGGGAQLYCGYIVEECGYIMDIRISFCSHLF